MLRQSGPRQVEDPAIMRKMPPGGRTLDLLGPPGSPTRATHGTVMTRSPRTVGAAEGEEVVRVVRVVREEQFDVSAPAEAVGGCPQERARTASYPRHPGADGCGPVAEHGPGRLRGAAAGAVHGERTAQFGGARAQFVSPGAPAAQNGHRSVARPVRVQHEPGFVVRGRSLTGPCQPAVHRRLQRARADRGRPHGARRAGLGQAGSAPCTAFRSPPPSGPRPRPAPPPPRPRRFRVHHRPAVPPGRHRRRDRPQPLQRGRCGSRNFASPGSATEPTQTGVPDHPARCHPCALAGGPRRAPVPPASGRGRRAVPRPPASSPLSPPVKGVRATGLPGASRPCGRARSRPFEPPRAPCCPAVPEGRGPLTRTRKLQPLATLVKQA